MDIRYFNIICNVISDLPNKNSQKDISKLRFIKHLERSFGCPILSLIDDVPRFNKNSRNFNTLKRKLTRKMIERGHNDMLQYFVKHDQRFKKVLAGHAK